MSEKIKLENLPEMATKVNAASRALGALQPEQKAGTNVVRKILVQSVMGEILSAGARGRDRIRMDQTVGPEDRDSADDPQLQVHHFPHESG